MFGKKVHLFSLFGFSVGVDASWLFLALLVTWSLATGLFPAMHEGWSTTTYWVMGALGALGLFGSIVFHELGHSLVARRFGLPMKGITLFLFGGVADMDDEPPSATAEFAMAVTGPLTSIGIALVLFLVSRLVPPAFEDAPILAVISYLAFLNLVLAMFNMVPAFPLDGGRVLRSVLWGWKGNLRWATNICSQIGAGFGLFLMFLGALSLIGGNFLMGFWWIMLGIFVRSASQSSYKQLLIRDALQGEDLSRFMKTDVVTVPRSASLEEVVEDYVYKFHYKMFPVVDGDRLVGCVSTRDIREVPREEWASTPVMEIAGKCSDENTIEPDADPMKVLSRMNQSDKSRLMVVEDGKLLGVVTLRDMLGFLSLKFDLESIE